jgi:hypothetical protein
MNSIDTTQTAHPRGYSVAGTKDGVLRRLRRIEGQVRGVAASRRPILSRPGKEPV